MTWLTFSLLRILFLIAFKNLNSQLALGNGVSKTNNKKQTGGTNTKGWVYGNTSNKTDQVCFLGIEDLWGNLNQWVDGICIDGSGNIKISNDNVNFNDEYSGYIRVGKTATTSQFIKTVNKNSQGLFIPTASGGSDTTYYCDYTLLRTGYVGTFGGCWTDDNRCGLFNAEFNYYPSTQIDNGTSRLCYLG